MTVIARDEWLKALSEAEQVPLDPSALTVSEIGQLLNVSPRAAYNRMRRLVASGKASLTRKLMRRADGHRQWYSAYRLHRNVKLKP